jgi:alpha-tubulin suppressor-like RCC1 family protein
MDDEAAAHSHAGDLLAPVCAGEALAISLQQLDTALLEVILWKLDARALAAVGSCSCSLQQTVAVVAEARCAGDGDARWSTRAALLQRRPDETFVQVLALREQAERRTGGCRLLAAGAAHTAVVSPCGSLFACGRNGSGQLGTGQTHDNGFEEFEESLAVVSFVEQSGSKIVCCSCGDESTLAVDENLRLFSWGHGYGSGEVTVPLPHLIQMPVLVSSVASGGQHVAAIDVECRLWTWGTGVHGQLGHPDATSLPLPKLVATFSEEACSEEGAPGQMPPRAASVDCGAEHTAVVCTTGCLWTFGRGWLGHGRPALAQLTPRKVAPDGLPDTNFVDVSCGEGHTAVLTDAGGVFTFGFDNVGQLGHSRDGSQLGVRPPMPSPCRVDHPDLNAAGVVQVACGKRHTVVLTGLGTVYSWGDGLSGQLGHDEYPPMMRQIGDAPGYCSEPLLVVMPPPCRRLRASANLRQRPPVCATGDLTPEPAPEIVERVENQQERVVEICCGAAHSMARLASGRLVSWGNGSWGRLGQGGEQDAREPAEVVTPAEWY